MQVQEVADLRKAEKLKTLRQPKCNEGITDEQKKELDDFAYGLCYLFTYLPQKLDAIEADNLVRRAGFRRLLNKYKIKLLKNIHSKQAEKLIKKLSFVKSLEKDKNKANCYNISTTYGDGKFFLDREIFIDKKYPEFIQKNFCFGNCLRFCRIEENKDRDIKILSGICGAIYDPICHSVISLDDKYIIDFNIGVVMTKSLYLKLCQFEVLSEVSAEDVRAKYHVLIENSDIANEYGSTPAAFCFNEFVDYIQKLKNGDVEPVESKYMY